MLVWLRTFVVQCVRAGGGYVSCGEAAGGERGGEREEKKELLMRRMNERREGIADLPMRLKQPCSIDLRNN